MNTKVVAATLGAVLATEVIVKREHSEPHTHFDSDYIEQNSRIGSSIYGIQFDRPNYSGQTTYNSFYSKSKSFVDFPTLAGQGSFEE